VEKVSEKETRHGKFEMFKLESGKSIKAKIRSMNDTEDWLDEAADVIALGEPVDSITSALASVCKVLPGEQLWEIPKRWSMAQLYYTVKALNNLQERADTDSNKRAVSKSTDTTTDTQFIQQYAHSCPINAEAYPGSPEDLAMKEAQ
jgi:hypothetical protein